MLGLNFRHGAMTASYPGDPVLCQNSRISPGSSRERAKVDDWDRVHKHECKVLEVDQDALRNEGLWVPHRSRHIHLLAIQRQMNALKDSNFIEKATLCIMHHAGVNAMASKDFIYVLRSFASETDTTLSLEKYRRKAAKR
ncbi:hypothetical protein CC1G_13252 [Coprinopsis cinerea okayama7|uniref:Uncharacterized protein n=1 Tax=Coprinopsis cinerea (strain Okayama-7 / 130 / ATCC MYA-4618 / FGSC 9003) TaxID=240176 RepID=A8PI59_COPC7|nr:hypothetical protein CC1G_13252 [Coprinopsis cinerea okayama7\|eukprot:XP_001841520.2 hypothetical protein CC1G_13252 [Coprinopsis cinerea okayama7\